MEVNVLEFLTEFDYSILDFIYRNIRCDFLDPIMAVLSYMAYNGIGLIVIAVVLIIPRKTRVWGCMALCAITLGFICGDLIIKNLVCRVRPYDDYQNFHNAVMPFTLNAGKETSYSFPSGHSCCAFASAVVYFKANKKIGTVALIIAALIAFSRMYNYVHFLTDVIAGSALGAISAIIVIWLFDKFNVEQKILKPKT